MSGNLNISYLISQMFGANTKAANLINPIRISDLAGGVWNKQLKAAGIDINSRQYKAVLADMTKDKGSYSMFTNIQAIKNRMKQYNSDGDYIGDGDVVPGMVVPEGADILTWHKIIDVSEDARQEMFEETKRHFLQENGVANGDTTNRSEVFRNYQLSVPKGDRLKGTWTLGQYERAYRQAFYDAAKAADPSWELGDPIKAGALEGIARESVDASLVKGNGEYGETLARGIDISL